MQYRKMVLYYFSGTGNSKKVALWLNQVAALHRVDCELVNIALIDRKNRPNPDPEALVVFISPVHGFNYPPVMMHFIRRFPKGKNNVVLMNTRAGMLIGKWVTPGLSGIAFYLSALFLVIKGFSIQAIFPVDLPSNWISVHPGLNQRTIQYIYKTVKPRVISFGEKILTGKKQFKALREFYDPFFLPIALLYYAVGRFFFAKSYYASRDCDNCGLCSKGCPVHAIIQVDQRPFWTYRCESCMKCMGNCPKKAIETGHGYVAGALLIFYPVLIGLFYDFFDKHFFKLENELLKMLVESALFLAFFAIWYRLIHLLLRFRLFERLVVYTSLTKYKFWGRRHKATPMKK